MGSLSALLAQQHPQLFCFPWSPSSGSLARLAQQTVAEPSPSVRPLQPWDAGLVKAASRVVPGPLPGFDARRIVRPPPATAHKKHRAQ